MLPIGFLASGNNTKLQYGRRTNPFAFLWLPIVPWCCHEATSISFEYLLVRKKQQCLWNVLLIQCLIGARTLHDAENNALYWYNIFQWGVQRWAHVVKVHNADFMLPIKHSMLKLRYNAWLGLEPLWCLNHVFVNEHYADITLQKRAPCIVCVVKKRTMLNKRC